MEESLKMSLMDQDDMPEAQKEFERNSKWGGIFEEMVESGKILVVEGRIKELEKIQRVILEMAKRYVPEDLKAETRRTDNVLIARLTEKKERPASLGQLLNRARHKTVSELERLGVFGPNTEPAIQDYLAESTQ